MTDPEPAHPAFSAYLRDAAYDEMFDAAGAPRPHYRALYERLLELARRRAALRASRRPTSRSCNQGITFTVYGAGRGHRAHLPLRPAAAHHHRAPSGDTIERGLTQRITALNLFLNDIYHEAQILRRRRRPARAGLQLPALPPRDAAASPCRATSTSRSSAPTWCACRDGRFVVLEDNLRVPSGVSYMLANRQVMKRVFPRLFSNYGVRPDRPLRPGAAGHAALAGARRSRAEPDHRAADARRLQLGLFRAHLPGPADGHRAGRGPRPGRARQRRLHADHGRAAAGGRDLPPHRRRLPRSAGVPPRLDRWACPACSTPTAPGNVALANAIGTGVADDKAVYAYVPAHHPVLPGRGPDPAQRRDLPAVGRRRSATHVLEHLDKLVVKAVGESGGYGMLIGPHSTAAQREEFRQRDPGQPAQLHRPADAGAVDARRASSTAASSRATSTCGRTSSTARRSRSCPAG